jgi:two-component system cell cycle response regulator
VLIVDADGAAAEAHAEVFAREGHRVQLATELGTAFGDYDVIVIDPGSIDPGDIVDLIRPSAHNNAPEVVLVSGRQDVDTAVAALHRGASDYLVKPVAPQRLRLALGRALERRRLLNENARLRRDLALFAAAQRLLEHLEPIDLATNGADALCAVASGAAAAVWAGDVRAARGLDADEAELLFHRPLPAGFVEHHVGAAVGLPRFAVVMLLDLGDGVTAAVAFDSTPTATQQEGLFFLARQLSTAFANAARYRDAADQALRDPLTGLWNAAAFAQAVDRLLSTSNGPLCVLFLDLDHFKKVNDTWGHLVGSRVIVAVARVVERAVREGDVVARYGGDELMVLLPEVDASIGMIVGERIRVAVAAMTMDDVPGLSLTVSCGVASAPAATSTNPRPLGRDLASVVEAADRAMYEAKASSRNQVRRAPIATRLVDDDRPATPPTE